MVITLSEEDTWRGIIGGIIIGLSTSINLYLKGRITGFSGVFYGLISWNNPIWRLGIVLGMLFMSIFYYTYFDMSFYDKPEYFIKDLPNSVILLSGFLVGFGTKLGNGCTSGHGLCGCARFSIRSIVATGLFLGFGLLFGSLREEMGIYNFPDFELNINSDINYHYIISGIISCVIVATGLIIWKKKGKEELYDFLISFLVGLVASLGLIISGMNSRQKVLAFLTLKSGWNPQLLLVFASGLLTNLILWNIILRKFDKPLLAKNFELPKNTRIDIPLIVGSITFGIGWGISGLCPGPAIILSLVYVPHIVLFIIFLAIGQFSAVGVLKLKEHLQNR